MFNFKEKFLNWLVTYFWPRFKIAYLNFIYINARFLPLTILSIILYFLGQAYGSLILQGLYFLWIIWKNYKFQKDSFRSTRLIWDSPISLIIGKLGTGKTLYLTYLLKMIKLHAKHIYSNYPVLEKNAKLATFRNIDFYDRKKLIPEKNSFVAFDESYLYIDGTDPRKNKDIHAGKLPYILTARHIDNRVSLTAQRKGMIWNEFRELSTAVVIPLHLKKPRVFSFMRPIFPKSFIFNFAVFQDIDDFEIWRVEAVKRIVEGKKLKSKSNDALGIHFFKIIIPFDIALSYNSKWLNFVRDLKNDLIENKEEAYWNDLNNLSKDDIIKLVDLDVLFKKLGLKE